MKKIVAITLLALFANNSFANSCPTADVINSNLTWNINGLMYVSFPGENGIKWFSGIGKDSFWIPKDSNSKIASFKRVKLTNDKSMVQCEYIASMENGQYTKEVHVSLETVAQFKGSTPQWVAKGEVCEQESPTACTFEQIK